MLTMLRWAIHGRASVYTPWAPAHPSRHGCGECARLFATGSDSSERIPSRGWRTQASRQKTLVTQTGASLRAFRYEFGSIPERSGTRCQCVSSASRIGSGMFSALAAQASRARSIPLRISSLAQGQPERATC